MGHMLPCALILTQRITDEAELIAIGERPFDERRPHPLTDTGKGLVDQFLAPMPTKRPYSPKTVARRAAKGGSCTIQEAIGEAAEIWNVPRFTGL